LRARWLAVALVALAAALAPAGAVFASDAVRVQADGVAKLPPFVPGAPAARPPDAAALREMRQAAVANGVEAAVLAQASELAREDVREDEAALRAALGPLADYTLGYGVLAEIGPREAKPKRKPGDPAPRPRRPKDPVPMEHAWRIEALVDGARLLGALRAAGLALTSGADSTALAEVVLESPYDAAGYAALRARLSALGAASVVPRRFSAEGVVLNVRGLPPEMLRHRLESQPPVGFTAETSASEAAPSEVRVRLVRAGAAAAGDFAPKRTSSD
jgi:hypothetical protein